VADRGNEQRRGSADPGPDAVTGSALVRGLASACHPLPTVAVTAISCALAALAGDSAVQVVLVTVAVFVGQLSIGWSNDAIDADRDRRSNRADKPVAVGAVPVVVVARAGGLALVAAIALSLLLGPRAGGAALLIVAAGWVYNAGLKATFWSWVPYAVAFGALPAVATLARSDHPFPAGWAVAAGALLGVAAHLANVAPDLADDLATGVRGLPHRLGRRGTSLLGPVLLAAAAVVVFAGAGSAHRPWRVAALVLSLGAAGAAAVIATRAEPGRRYFVVTLVAAGLDVALFGLSGHRLA
jgi:4-hydroxybenzoate polyprenyltransferase